ncbi:MAG: hypothetical protein ACP5KG_06735 [Myxococcota bacterium]
MHRKPNCRFIISTHADIAGNYRAYIWMAERDNTGEDTIWRNPQRLPVCPTCINSDIPDNIDIGARVSQWDDGNTIYFLRYTVGQNFKIYSAVRSLEAYLPTTIQKSGSERLF